MQKYVDYLIEDIRKAAKNLPSQPYLDLPEEMEALRGVIEYETTLEKPMQDWFKLSRESFPVEKLNIKQVQLLVKEILKLWKVFNFDPVLPKNLPAGITYKLLVEYLEKPVIWVSDGMIGIEFCDYDTKNCPFPKEYCMCTELDDNENDTFDNSREINELGWEIEVFLTEKSPKFRPKKKIQKYVDQLINDLNLKAKEARERPIFPDNIDIRSKKNDLELVLKPFVTLEVLSGIKQSVFPEITDMDRIQINQLLIAILQFFDAYKLKIHHPDNIPSEIKYEAIYTEWDNIYVKDLPLSGDDIELCTGEMQTCPYFLYCDCNEDIDDEFLDEDEPNKKLLDQLPFDDLPFDDDLKDDDNDEELPV
jgi:hypothetical protein